MKNLTAMLLMMDLLAAVTARAEMPTKAWQIEPCSRVGGITATTSRQDLVQWFGAENVQDTKVAGAEGEDFEATVIYPNQPTKRLEVLWKDAQAMKSPAVIRIIGERSAYKTLDGITLGTTLKDLEKLNGGTFVISGFYWDYGGHVMSWEQGKLAFLQRAGFILQFDVPAATKPTGAKLQAISGDKRIKSSDPTLQFVNPVVREMDCNFP